MDSGFWHRRWRKNEIAFHQEAGCRHLREFWPTLGLANGRQVFVPLCGKSQDLIWLAQQKHPILGIELSDVAVSDFFQEHELTPQRMSAGAFEVWESDAIKLLCGDFFALTTTDLENVAGVYDRAALIALPPAMRQDYVEHLLGILPPGTPILLVTLEYPQELMDGPPFCVREEEVRMLFGRYYTVELLKIHDAFPENPRFQNRGLPYLNEKIYRLIECA
ncbi:MAG: thiopurine S-methyltransferase [Candidatus Competibacteraceae bacterium]|nr:thiopurine S-methyltransferase [Candidatus Competibacteraceae bacterium]